MTSDNMLSALFKNERELFLENLGSYTILDIGTIDSIDEKGRATVTTNQYVGGKRVIYQDVEVIYPGNTGGVYQASCSGSACLIFIPYTCIPNIQSQMVRIAAQPYYKDGIKAMPIGNGSDCSIKQIFDTYGNLMISTNVYELLFNEDVITLQQDTTLNITKALDGSLYLFYKDEDSGPLEININKEGVSHTYTSKDGSVVWKDTIDTDGIRTLVQEDGNGNALNTITIDTDGTLNVENAKDIVVNTDGDIKMNGDSKHLVKFEDLKAAMDKLYLALTTTPISGNGAPQPTWSGITSIDISAAKADTLLTGD